jgi:Helix-turn-helix domain
VADDVFTAIRWAFEQAPIPVGDIGEPTLRHVLQALAWHSDGDTGKNSYPSVERICAETGLGDRAVRGALRVLESSGLIVRCGRGPKGTTRWDLSLASRCPVPIDEVVEAAQEARRLADKKRQARKRGKADVTAPGAVTVTADAAVTMDVTAARAVMSRQMLPDVTAGAAPDQPITNPVPTQQTSPPAPPTPKAKKLRAVGPRRDDVEQICAFLVKAIHERDPKSKATVTDDWRKAARLLLDADGRPFQEAMAVLAWSQDHTGNGKFSWRRNILSMPTFREKFETLRGQWEDDPAAPKMPSTVDRQAWINEQWQAGHVTEIHEFYKVGWTAPDNLGTGDYAEDVLRPYNRRWIKEHAAAILRCFEAGELAA